MFLFCFALIYILLPYTQNWPSTNDFLEDLHRGGAHIMSTQRIGADFFLNIPHLLTFLKSPPGPSAGARPSWLFIIDNKSPSSSPSSCHHRHQNQHNNNHNQWKPEEEAEPLRCLGARGAGKDFLHYSFFILINTCHSHGRYLFTIFLYYYLWKNISLSFYLARRCVLCRLHIPTTWVLKSNR